MAPATPPGEGGVAVVRLSGPDAPAVLARVFRSSRPVSRWQSHRLYLGEVVDREVVLDEALAVWMRAPHSYTREQVVEIHLHGSPTLVRAVLDLCCAAGARLARAGEFTLRAFLNGRLSLAQAESVARLIASESRAELESSARDLKGRFTAQVEALRQELLDWLSRLEAELDFGDEVPGLPVAESLKLWSGLTGRVKALLDGSEDGRLGTGGLRVALIGPPNAGKSTLLNALLGEERALVSPHPGTTRDRLEESVRMGGRVFRLVDTAGIRSTQDPVERMGVELTERAAREAQLRVLVLDASQPAPEQDLRSWSPDLVVLNKIDLPPRLDRFEGAPAVRVSAREGLGLEELVGRLVALAAERGETRNFLTDRQRAALHVVFSHLEAVGETLEAGHPAEFLCLDLRAAVQALGEILGLEVTEEILDRIFSSFCLGK